MDINWEDVYAPQSGTSWKKLVSCGAAVVASLIHAKYKTQVNVQEIRETVDAEFKPLQHVWNYDRLEDVLKFYDFECKRIKLADLMAAHRRDPEAVYVFQYKPCVLPEEARRFISPAASYWRRTALLTSLGPKSRLCVFNDPSEFEGVRGVGIRVSTHEFLKAVLATAQSDVLCVSTKGWK